jgi:uncharacterized membrane protein (UPF0127 family)
MHGFRVERADHFYRRLIGWLGRTQIQDDELLWISPCRCVHTLGMRVALSLFFVDRHGLIIQVVPNAKPGRIFACVRAHAVIEASAFACVSAQCQQRLGAIQAVALMLSDCPNTLV